MLEKYGFITQPFHVFRFELLFTGQIEFEEHGALQLTIRESERVAEQTK